MLASYIAKHHLAFFRNCFRILCNVFRAVSLMSLHQSISRYHLQNLLSTNQYIVVNVQTQISLF
nr:MAG TPA: hypothetical protein [Caudoviricetes sp.]